MAQKTYSYKDLDIAFIAHPVSGDISKKTDAEAVKQSIRNLMKMNYYDKPFSPEIGSGINALLFEPMTPILDISLKKNIENLIKNYEPRCELKEIRISENMFNGNQIDIEITFYVINTVIPVTFTTTMARVR